MLLGVKPCKSLPKLWCDCNQKPLSLWMAKLMLDGGETDPSASSQVAALPEYPWKLGCAAGLNDAEVQGKGLFWFCDNGMVRGSSPGQHFMRDSFLMWRQACSSTREGSFPSWWTCTQHTCTHTYMWSHIQGSCSLLLHCCNRPGCLRGL